MSIFVGASQLAISKMTWKIGNEPNHPIPIPNETLLAGFGPFVSAICWIQTIFCYSGVLFDEEPYQPLVVRFQSTIFSDTLWEHPRLIAAWALPEIKGVPKNEVLTFLQEGTNRFPREWRFRLTWAEYVLDAHDLDSTVALDSAAKILLPLSTIDAKVPQYARDLAFTLLHKSGKPEEAMSLLLKTYEEVNDPLVRLQFRGKIGDLLLRNHVPLGSDSADFMDGIAALLETKDPADHALADHLLTDLVDTSKRESALASARRLADQYKSFRTASP